MNMLKSMLVAVAFVVTASAASAQTVSLTSLEWPPYTGDALAEKGASVKIAEAAFEAAGKQLEVAFYPWVRAVETAKQDENFLGYFPEYYAKEIEADFIFSERMGDSPLGFIQQAANPVQWETLNDLKGVSIGTVQGYVNTAEFDEMAASGALNIDAATDDATNIKKVAAGRLDLAVIDKYVFEYLISTDPALGKLKDKISFNDKLLELKGLHICFRRSPEGQSMADAFNAGLAKIDYKAIEAEYMAKALSN
jgi:polar amino acid transport system substrate-binding protein